MLHTTTFASPLGTLLLKATEGHLTSLLFIDDKEMAEGNSADSPVLDLCLRQLEEYFTGARKNFDLPLGQEGTGFQKKVWELLCGIPYGRTISYADLANRYGDPKAIRAIAAANGRNQLAIIVPCHRVIGTNRSLTGYAGGLWRKQWLLEHEAKHHTGIRQARVF